MEKSERKPQPTQPAPRVAPGTFTRGFISSMGSGAKMMAIFSGVMMVAGLLGLVAAPGIVAAVTMIGIGSVSTGLFGGMNAVDRAKDELRMATRLSEQASRVPARAPEQERSATPQAAMAQTVNRQGNWVNSVSRSGSNKERIDAIIADRGLDDKGRAAAILAERQQAQTTNTHR